MRLIAHFELLDKLGAGGMGEVFKARDTRLNRFVALKFLPESATTDARERFQREALAIAALSHPNICALHEIGDDQGRPFLVLELLEGESLRARLAKGPVPAAQLLDWGAQIAEALDAAHKRGVLHRDLKPDNIFVLPGGHIKVLDFGLARLETEAQSSGSNDRTLTSPGVTLGTVPYMSPEQAKGEPLDARSDIFSFGSVFYEMAAGRQAFPPRSAAETIAAILKDQPPSLRKARPELAPKVEEVAVRCLEKDPDLRYQSAADLRSELRRLSRISASHAADDPAPSASAVAVASTPSSAPAIPLSDSQIVSGLLRRHWRWPALAILAVAAAAFAVWRFLPRPQSNAAPPRLQFRQLTYSGQVLDAVISPDGKFLVHVDNSPQGTSLHLMSVANGSDTVIVPPATGCCFSPSFSPDGSEITFVEGRTLKTVPVLGGAINTISTQACSGTGFSPHGRRIAYLASTRNSDELVLANPDGSDLRVLRVAPAGDGYISQCFGGLGNTTHSPSWSPDGKWLALDLGRGNQTTVIELVNTGDGHTLDLGPNLNFGGADVAWLPNGRDLVFTASLPASAPPQLWEMAYLSGRLTQLTNDIQGYTNVSAAANGELSLVHSAPQYSIWTQQHPGGAFQQLPGGGAGLDGAAGLAWTANDSIASLRNYGGQVQIWSAGIDGSNAHRVGSVGFPASTIDLQSAANGDLIVVADYSSPSIWRVHAGGSGLAQLVHPAPGAQASFAFLLHGGKDVGYWYADKNSDQTLWSVPVNGGAPSQLWSGFVFADGNPSSPDGSRVFAVTQGPDQSHQPVVLTLSPTPRVAPRVQHLALDFFATAQPFGWTADGRAVTYLQRTGSLDNIWAFPIAGGQPYAVTHFKTMNIAAYAFAKDGRLAVSRGSQYSDVVLVTGISPKSH